VVQHAHERDGLRQRAVLAVLARLAEERPAEPGRADRAGRQAAAELAVRQWCGEPHEAPPALRSASYFSLATAYEASDAFRNTSRNAACMSGPDSLATLPCSAATTADSSPLSDPSISASVVSSSSTAMRRFGVMPSAPAVTVRAISFIATSFPPPRVVQSAPPRVRDGCGPSPP